MPFDPKKLRSQHLSSVNVQGGARRMGILGLTPPIGPEPARPVHAAAPPSTSGPGGGPGASRGGAPSRGSRSDVGPVVITDYDFGDVDIERKIIEGAGFALVAKQCRSESDVIAAASDASGVITQHVRVGARAIRAFTRCHVIARYGTGVDIVDVEAATRRGIQVITAPIDWCADEVADHAIALWLVAARKIAEYASATRRGEWRWQTGQPIHRLRGRVFGLLSFGAIAQKIAERARPFGVEIWVHDPFIDDDDVRRAHARPVSFDELARGSDYLVIQAPLTADTRGLFDERLLRTMKRTAILVNTARGPVVVDAALYRALKEGWIAGAALDDIEEEPAKQRDWQPDNRLFELENAIITPHAASYSEESIRSVREIAANEVVRVLTGQRPLSSVNLDQIRSAMHH